jgi:ribonuclease D
MSSSSKPVWVDTDFLLQKVVKEILHNRRIGVDTESNSLFAYQEQICLIQISTPRTDYLLDTLTLTNVGHLKEVFENPRIEKIFHAAEYDLICLKRDYGFQPVHLFDTMLAARILALPEVGLGALLKNRFGIDVDKRYQRANWGERPLPEILMQYACGDSHHLIPLRNQLEQDLIKHKLYTLAKEDFIRLESVKIPVQRSKAGFPHLNGNGKFAPRQRAVLQALCEYRDREAQRRDVPHFKVFGDDVLLTLAHRLPRKIEDLKGIPGLPSRLIQLYGNSLVKEVHKGMKAQPPRYQPRSHADSGFVQRLDQLKHWRKMTAEELHMDSDVILPRDTMEAIARAQPVSLRDLGVVMEGQTWRLKQYGNSILSAITPKETT